MGIITGAVKKANKKVSGFIAISLFPLRRRNKSVGFMMRHPFAGV